MHTTMDFSLHSTTSLGRTGDLTLILYRFGICLVAVHIEFRYFQWEEGDEEGVILVGFHMVSITSLGVLRLYAG